VKEQKEKLLVTIFNLPMIAVVAVIVFLFFEIGIPLLIDWIFAL